MSSIVFNPPPTFSNNPREMAEQFRAYLFQLNRDLNIALEQINGDQESNVAPEQGGHAAADAKPTDFANEARKLKALIIKTAHTIEKQMDEWTAVFEGSYLAKSDFGTYLEKNKLTIEVTATEVVNRFQYDSLIQAAEAKIYELEHQVEALEQEKAGLEAYKVETEQYTKSGLLYYDDSNVPIYGYAVGEVLSRVIVNGEETVRRENLLATFSAGQLNFWQNGKIIAYYANSKLYVTTGEFLDSIIIGDWAITGKGNFELDYAGDK